MQKVFNEIYNQNIEKSSSIIPEDYQNIFQIFFYIAIGLGIVLFIDVMVKEKKREKAGAFEKILLFITGIFICISLIVTLTETKNTTAKNISKPLKEQLYLTKKGDYRISSPTSNDAEDNILYIYDINSKDLLYGQTNDIEIKPETQEIKALTKNGKILIDEYNELFERIKGNKNISDVKIINDDADIPMITYLDNDVYTKITYKYKEETIQIK